jgi:hypothetical protein
MFNIRIHLQGRSPENVSLIRWHPATQCHNPEDHSMVWERSREQPPDIIIVQILKHGLVNAEEVFECLNFYKSSCSSESYMGNSVFAVAS